LSFHVCLILPSAACNSILICVSGMQALALCQHGKEDLADTILTRLNCTYRLAPAVLMPNAQAMPSTASADPLDASLPCVIRDAISGAPLQSPHHWLGPHVLLGLHMHGMHCRVLLASGSLDVSGNAAF